MKVLEYLLKISSNPPSFSDLKEDFANIAHVKLYDISEGKIILESSYTGEEIENVLQKNFSDVKLVGLNSNTHSQSSAVAIIGGNGASGVIRLLGNEEEIKIEGTVRGLDKGIYTVSINEYGDISDGCSSTGDPLYKNSQPLGLLGKIESDGCLDTQFVLKSRLCLAECTGRSLVVQCEKSKIACGIIGRSSGIDQNSKKICSCDGTVIWDDQNLGPFAVTPGVHR